MHLKRPPTSALAPPNRPWRKGLAVRPAAAPAA